MDTVEEILAAVKSLPVEERERLLAALAAEYGAELVSRPSQLELGAAFEVPTPVEEADYILVFDGGSHGNPGPGYGSYVLIRRRDGAQRVIRLDFEEEMTNNEAEYRALIAGLEDLIARIQRAGRDPAEFSVEVRGDSALVINQVVGKWQAKDVRMRALRNQVRALLSRFAGYALHPQAREESVRLLGH